MSPLAKYSFPMSPPHFEDPPQTPDPILAASANGKRFWPGSTTPPQSSTMGGKRHSSGSALPPLESASAVGITNGLGDLSLTKEFAPPPGKIRRRNALPTSDLFLQSRELQRLQDMSPSAGSEQPPTPMNPLMTDFADLSLQKKRKVPKGARMMRQQMQQRQRTRATCRNPEPPKEKEEGMGSDEESITRISLHQTLASIRPMGEEILPVTLFEQFRESQERHSRAMVLYRPPTNLVEKMLGGGGGAGGRGEPDGKEEGRDGSPDKADAAGGAGSSDENSSGSASSDKDKDVDMS